MWPGYAFCARVVACVCVCVPFENWLRVYFICLNRFHFYLIIRCDFGWLCSFREIVLFHIIGSGFIVPLLFWWVCVCVRVRVWVDSFFTYFCVFSFQIDRRRRRCFLLVFSLSWTTMDPANEVCTLFISPSSCIGFDHWLLGFSLFSFILANRILIHLFIQSFPHRVSWSSLLACVCFFTILFCFSTITMFAYKRIY